MLSVKQDGADWVVRNESGDVLHRGPEWTCWLYAAEVEQDDRRKAVTDG